MKLLQFKSKWQVTDDNGTVRSTHKSKKAAELAKEVMEALYAWDGERWDRLTPRQRELVESEQQKRRRVVWS